jgi:hypothetical protein
MFIWGRGLRKRYIPTMRRFIEARVLLTDLN